MPLSLPEMVSCTILSRSSFSFCLPPVIFPFSRCTFFYCTACSFPLSHISEMYASALTLSILRSNINTIFT